jgi:acyl-ACP thioesterase
MEALLKTTSVDRVRWKSYLKPGSREDADEIREFPIRVSDIDLFDHVNNSVYWKVVEEFLAPHPELLEAPLRVAIEHDAAIAYGEKLEILLHVYPAGSTDEFGPKLTDRTVRTLTYLVGDEVKALAAIFPL